jgi:2-polyprenyl-6-methoxyphenol hydroxylase-like FAD-dependent oxidoreductase
VDGKNVVEVSAVSVLFMTRGISSSNVVSLFQRHDGTEVAVADETVLARKTSHGDKDGEQTDMDIQPIGIRRWKLQKILYDAAVEAGVVVHFGKRLDTIQESTGGIVHLQFDDGSTCDTKLLLAADGAKSRTRSIVTDGTCVLKYLGTTCLMGTSTTTPRENRGLMLPTSPTTKCHGAFYPTGETEQCFQFHFPTTRDNVSDAALGGWGGMTHTMSQEECHELAQQLEKEGWDEERFLQPLQNVDKALRVGLTTLDPPLQKFSFGHVVLVGDAAHPPVPYLGQGAQQGLEDAGTLALLLKQFCVVADGEDNGQFTLDRIEDALQAYNELRVPRSNDMVEHGKLAGKQQQKRAENQKYNLVREELIQREVFYNENSAHLFLGAHHDYKEAVGSFLKSYDSCLSKERKAISEPHLQTVPEEG